VSAPVDEALDLLEKACRETGGNGWFMGRLGKHPAMLELLRRASSTAAARAESDALRAALEGLVGTLGSVEFRANFFGLTCSQDDARRIAVAVDSARAALAPSPAEPAALEREP